MQEPNTTSPVAEVIRPLSTSPTVSPTMDFPKAIEQLITGKQITKEEWNNKDEYGLMKDGWLMIHHAGKTENNIWKVSEADMTGTDWVAIQDNN